MVLGLLSTPSAAPEKGSHPRVYRQHLPCQTEPPQSVVQAERQQVSRAGRKTVPGQVSSEQCLAKGWHLHLPAAESFWLHCRLNHTLWGVPFMANAKAKVSVGHRKPTTISSNAQPSV